MPVPTIVELALAAIQLAQSLAARAQASGELTEEQRAVLGKKALDLFILYSTAPPAPAAAR